MTDEIITIRKVTGETKNLFTVDSTNLDFRPVFDEIREDEKSYWFFIENCGVGRRPKEWIVNIEDFRFLVKPF